MTRAFLSACLLLAACNPAGTPPTTDDVAPVSELRVHAIPDGSGGTLKPQLSLLLKDQGRVGIAPDGKLLVVAPQSIQDGVAAMVADLGPGQVKAASNVRIDYWIVSGRPADESKREDAALNAISPALDLVEGRLGPQLFILYGAHSVMTLDGHVGSVRTTHPMWIRQNASVSRSGAVIADLQIETRGGEGASIETRVQIEPGKLVVLGEVGNSGAETMYFVIRPVVE